VLQCVQHAYGLVSAIVSTLLLHAQHRQHSSWRAACLYCGEDCKPDGADCARECGSQAQGAPERAESSASDVRWQEPAAGSGEAAGGAGVRCSPCATCLGAFVCSQCTVEGHQAGRPGFPWWMGLLTVIVPFCMLAAPPCLGGWVLHLHAALPGSRIHVTLLSLV
jgi:hypothetical protein